MKKVDCEINNWVASWMVGNYDWITDATADCEENYGIDDVVFSAVTTCGDMIVKQQEVKSIKGGFQLKYDGDWNNYFSADNPNGIIKNMMFGNVPPHSMDIMEVPLQWEPESFTPEYGEMPDEWKGKHIYILNAEDKYHRIHNSKTYKIYDNNACLAYVAPDGLVLYNPNTLRKAFLGYAWYKVKSHTEEFGEKRNPHYELKAVFDLDKGSYNSANPPKEFFKKKHYN